MNITYRLADQFAIADLALSVEDETRLRDALDSDEGTDISDEIEAAITAQLRKHGVTEDGEWLGDWSAAEIVRSILAAHE